MKTKKKGNNRNAGKIMELKRGWRGKPRNTIRRALSAASANQRPVRLESWGQTLIVSPHDSFEEVWRRFRRAWMIHSLPAVLLVTVLIFVAAAVICSSLFTSSLIAAVAGVLLFVLFGLPW